MYSLLALQCEVRQRGDRYIELGLQCRQLGPGGLVSRLLILYLKALNH